MRIFVLQICMCVWVENKVPKICHFQWQSILSDTTIQKNFCKSIPPNATFPVPTPQQHDNFNAYFYMRKQPVTICHTQTLYNCLGK